MPKLIDKQSKCPSSTQNQSTLKLVDLDICKKRTLCNICREKNKTYKLCKIINKNANTFYICTQKEETK